MIKAKKYFGQNFLKDQVILEQIIQSIPKDEDFIIEIGVGLGDLTQRLLEVAPIKAYEIDAELMGFLERKFQKQVENKSLELLNEDASKAVPSFDTQDFVLVANLPYYIASRLVLQALRDENCTAILVMVQKEVALKFCARSGTSDFCALSVLTRLLCAPRLLFEVGAQCFEPPPKVSSAVMLLKKEREFSEICGDICAFERFLRECFKAPRKQLLSNLKAHKGVLLPLFSQLGIKANARAHELCVKSFLEIYESIKEDYERQEKHLRGREVKQTLPLQAQEKIP